MRGFLDRFYVASGVLGAVSIGFIALLVLAQIVGRLLEISVPGADDFTAWLMAAVAFFSLAHTFRHGAHIRIGLLLDNVRGGWRKGIEIFCLAVALAISVAFAYAAFDLVYDSWRYNEVGQGLVSVALWIPQLPMALGALVLAIAILDDLAEVLAGRIPSYRRMQDSSGPPSE